MTRNEQKAAFSEAWLRAIASVAGFGIGPALCPDDQSVDISVTSRIKGIATNPRLDVQLKCTSSTLMHQEQSFSYPLPQNNYDDLRDPNVSVPKILVLVYVPDLPEDWMLCHPDRLEIYRSAWWVSLRGYPSNDNSSSTTIAVPIDQRFTPKALSDIMMRLAARLLP